MAIEKEPRTDENDDRVRIRLGRDDDVRTVENYSFRTSIFQQPSAFNIQISGAKGAADLLRKYTPGPDGACVLQIGKYKQFTGELDAIDAHGDGSRTTVVLKGRDLMARLHDNDIVGERSFNNASYRDLFKAALDANGLGDHGIHVDNGANRKVRSGARVRVYKEPVKAAEVQAGGSTAGKFKAVVTAKMGESWLTFLERHFGKLGLFAWCDADGDFILSRPNGDQAPLFSFFRKRGQDKSVSNVRSFSFTNDATHRFSHMVIFCRNLGRKYGHNHTNGRFDDVEMMSWGINRLRVYRDVNVASQEEAEFYCRKEIAQLNRASWKLQYTISGHSAPLVDDRDKRAVVIPDTVARVDDDELGIHENLYIESVEYHSSPRTSVVTMMRPQDLIFGENQALEGVKKATVAAAQAKQRRPRAPIVYQQENANDVTNVHRAAVSTVKRPERPK